MVNQYGSTWAAVTATEMTGAGSYGSEVLKAIGQAFDETWLQIAENFGDHPSDVEKTRAHFARALLSIAHEDSRNIPVLRQAALERMA